MSSIFFTLQIAILHNLHLLFYTYLLFLLKLLYPLFQYQSLNRVLEHQHVMQNLHAKLNAMEVLCASQEKQITLLATSVATAAAAVEISEKR